MVVSGTTASRWRGPEGSGQEAAADHLLGTVEHPSRLRRRYSLQSTKEHDMPKTTSRGTAKKSEIPSTLKKSPAKAQRTFAKAHDAAADQYGEGERAHRVAYSALKHSYEKVGDHWEAKDEKGPSDSRARSGGPNPSGSSAEGVD